MELSRRDALTALTAAGIASTAGCSSLLGGDDDTSGDNNEQAGDASPMETLLSLAGVLYPSEVETNEEFIETYMMGRITDEEAYQEELESGVETLNQLAQDEQDAPFHALDHEGKVAVIDGTEIRTGGSVEDGSDVERLNYYLVDELLFAFYSSPTGGELVGNQNPRGYPGGFGYSPPLEQ